MSIVGAVVAAIVVAAFIVVLRTFGAVSAPTSLAVQAAMRFGVTLVGFLRDDHYNVYSHPSRIKA